MTDAAYDYTDSDGDRLRFYDDGIIQVSTAGEYPSRMVRLHVEAARALAAKVSTFVEAADAREAAEARKLKAGDKVSLQGDPLALRTVVTDETGDGYIDIVIVLDDECPNLVGQLQRRVFANQYLRV